MSEQRPYISVVLLNQRMAVDGYYPRADSIDEGTKIDMAVCSELVCMVCDHDGLEYHPFTNDRGRYRAVGLCPQCGQAEEF